MKWSIGKPKTSKDVVKEKGPALYTLLNQLHPIANLSPIPPAHLPPKHEDTYSQKSAQIPRGLKRNSRSQGDLQFLLAEEAKRRPSEVQSVLSIDLETHQMMKSSARKNEGRHTKAQSPDVTSKHLDTRNVMRGFPQPKVASTTRQTVLRGQIGLGGSHEHSTPGIVHRTQLQSHRELPRKEPAAPKLKSSSDALAAAAPDVSNHKRLLDECETARGNVQLLNEALEYADVDDSQRNQLMQEFYQKCQTSQTIILSEIPGVTAQAERFANPPSSRASSRAAKEKTTNVLAVLQSASEELEQAISTYDAISNMAREKRWNKQASTHLGVPERSRTTNTSKGAGLPGSSTASIKASSTASPPSSSGSSSKSSLNRTISGSTKSSISSYASSLLESSIHQSNCDRGCHCRWRIILNQIGATTIQDRVRNLRELRVIVERAMKDEYIFHNVMNLRNNDALEFEDMLNKFIDSEPPGSPLYLDSQRWIRKIARRTGVLPHNLFVTDVSKEGDYPVEGGGCADIYRGFWSGRPVALKVLRIFATEAVLPRITKEFCQEALLWHHLQHQHILPLYGVSQDIFSPRLCLVSPWMTNGNIIQFLEKKPNVDRLQLLRQAAKGLLYLHFHEPSLVHGDMKGTNILVDDDEQARLTDFGLMTISRTETFATTYNSEPERGSLRWMAPELHEENSERTLESDVYAFGMTMYEVCTGKPPFLGKTDSQVLLSVTHKQRPSPPPLSQVDEELWKLITRCWEQAPQDRPTMKQVVDELEITSQTP